MNTKARDYIVSERIVENNRSYYLCNCPSCGEIRKVRSDSLDRIKSCHSCHHKVSRPKKPDGDVHWCNKCKSWKTKDSFNFRKDGKSRNCKSCENNYRLNNMARLNEYSKKYRKDNIEKSMLFAARTRAKEQGIQIDIEIEDVVVPEFCPVLGIKLSVDGTKNNSPSLDRIVPERGYTKGNVRVISWRANWIKNNATPDEIEKLYLDSKLMK
jgi:DNA replicative helicase MCM subunit Mcm2 (Cdc46/Mcm family)